MRAGAGLVLDEGRHAVEPERGEVAAVDVQCHALGAPRLGARLAQVEQLARDAAPARARGDAEPDDVADRDSTLDGAVVTFEQRAMPENPLILAAVDEVSPAPATEHGEADDEHADGTADEAQLIGDGAGPFVGDSVSRLADARAALVSSVRKPHFEGVAVSRS